MLPPATGGCGTTLAAQRPGVFAELAVSTSCSAVSHTRLEVGGVPAVPVLLSLLVSAAQVVALEDPW